MKHDTDLKRLQGLSIPGRVSVGPGNGGLPKLSIETDHSRAEIYSHGAHVTGYQKHGEPPLLFMSQRSQFTEGKPIRGGVPIVFPWFGPLEGVPAHGFGRLIVWDLCQTQVTSEGSVELRFELPQSALESNDLNLRVHYVVTVGKTLTMELTVNNTSADTVAEFECCLHTYFNVGDIEAVSVTGLKGISYLDSLAGFARKVENSEAIRIEAEVDRIYQDTVGTVEVHDANLCRVIRVEKSGSMSTVVWNPWVAKSKAMPDFGDDEYQRMVCVESGNIKDEQLTLGPGKLATLQVVLSSRPI